MYVRKVRFCLFGANKCDVALCSRPECPSPAAVSVVVLNIYTVDNMQLEGLSWMVAQHTRGLNSILADEMVRH